MFDHLAMIENQIADQEVQLGKILDLYLTGDFERGMLTERKLRLETNIVNLRKEHLEISSTLEKLTLTDDQISEIQEFCDGIRDRVETASFDEKRQLLELFDVRGKLAIENNEKVIHATCLLQLQLVSLALTSHSSNIGETVTMTCVCLSTARFP